MAQDSVDRTAGGFVPVYARSSTDAVVEQPVVTFFIWQADRRVVRDGVTGALIGVYELRPVG